MAKSRPQAMNELKKWQEWLINQVPKPARWEVREEFETFHGRVMSLYASHSPDTTTIHTHISPPPLMDNSYAAAISTHAPPRINLIANQTHVRNYEVTGPLNHHVSNLILDIEIQTRVVYSFSCTIYQRRNQVIHYNKMLSPDGTFMSLSQTEEYIQQCELWHLDLDDEGVRSKAYLPT